MVWNNEIIVWSNEIIGFDFTENEISLFYS